MEIPGKSLVMRNWLNLYIGDGDDVTRINDEEIDLSKFSDGDWGSTSSSSW